MDEITPPERAALDELGAVLDLVADRSTDLIDAVGDALLDGERHDVRRQTALRARIEMAAGRHDGVAGRHDAAAVDPAGLDRFGQRDVEQVPARLHEQAEVAHRREAGEQRAPGVGGPSQRHLHRIDRDRVGEPGSGTAENEVDLHVHQARDQRELRQFDHLVGAIGDTLVGGHGGDPLALDAHVARLDHLAGVDIEDAASVQDGDSLFGHRVLLTGLGVDRSCEA